MEAHRYEVKHRADLGYYILDHRTGLIVLRNLATSELAITRRNEWEAAARKQGGAR